MECCAPSFGGTQLYYTPPNDGAQHSITFYAFTLDPPAQPEADGFIEISDPVGGDVTLLLPAGAANKYDLTPGRNYTITPWASFSFFWDYQHMVTTDNP